MNAKFLAILVLVGAICLGGGYWMGSNEKSDTVVNGDDRVVTGNNSLLDPGNRPAGSKQKSGGSELRVDAKPENMERSLRASLKESDPFKRMSGVFGLLDQLSPQNLNAALAAFRDIPVRTDSELEYGLLLHAWGKFDPQAALKFAEENFHERSMPKASGIRSVLSGWAAEDPEAALEYVNNLEGDPNRYYIEGVLSGWMQTDPDAAAGYVIENMKPGRNREVLIGKLASQLMKQGMDTAVRWAERQQDPAFRGEAFEEITEDWVSLDPEAAAKWLSKHVDQEYSKEAVEDLARGWAFKDRQAAASWLENLSEGEVKSSGVHEFVKVWARKDPVGVAEWLNTLNDSGATDRGVTAYAQQIFDQSPEAALQSAASISNDEMREESMRHLASQWLRRDREAAEAWAVGEGYDLTALQAPQPVDGKLEFQGEHGSVLVEQNPEGGIAIDLGDGQSFKMQGNFKDVENALKQLGPEQAKQAQRAIERMMTRGNR